MAITRPVNYEQTDPRWRQMMYSAVRDKAQTIGLSGCGPTCAAMVIATLRDKSITPVQACAWAVANGYRTLNNGTLFDFFVKYFMQYDIECEQISSVTEAIKAIEAGQMVIGRALKGLWTSSGHYILAYEIEGNLILINDPNDPGIGSGKSGRERAPLATFRAQVGPFWIIKEEWRMQEADIRKIVQEELIAANKPVSGWAAKEWEEAKKLGITDGTRPQGVLTREQGAAMIVRATKK